MIVSPAPALDNLPTEEAVAPSCSACPHPWEAHDALGVRFCTATTASSLTRGCICTPAQSHPANTATR